MSERKGVESEVVAGEWTRKERENNGAREQTCDGGPKDEHFEMHSQKLYILRKLFRFCLSRFHGVG